ncbi:MAG: cysteine desulfurase [Planctomycetales bacterium]|nr:cysteine desulfurase [Planctomycetales bacterium]
MEERSQSRVPSHQDIDVRTLYFDYSTTTPMAASVRECMLPFLNEFYGHPSSCHWFGRAAQEAIEDARSNVASLLCCHPSEIAFTSGGTESVNIGLLGVARAISRSLVNFRPHMILSTLEHACVRMCAEQLEREGWQVSFVGCRPSGVVDLEEFKRAMRAETRLVSIIHASHRIGTIQPIAEISVLCQQHDVLLHTDAAQSVGKIKCDVSELGVDLLSFSGHKLYAPKGVGVLYSRLGVPIEPLIFGEGGDAGIRVGTPNVIGIVGLGQAAKLAEQGLSRALDRTSQLRDRFVAQLESLLGVRLKVHGQESPRVPGILSLELPGVSAAALQRRIPEICFGPSVPDHGNGNHNALSIREQLNGVPSRKSIHESSTAAFGPTEQQSIHTLRMSFGWTTSEDEMQQAAHLIAAAFDSLAT